MDTAQFESREVVVTEKMDGENTSLYRDYFHARSIDGRHHPSRDWVKGLHSRIAHLIPEGWRLCGENVFARHSLAYAGLPSYFLLFSIWNESNEALSWEETAEWAESLDLALVPVIYRGTWDERLARALSVDPETQEGFVVRIADRFAYGDFARSVAKWVRPGHVQTGEHWMRAEIRRNELAEVPRVAGKGP